VCLRTDRGRETRHKISHMAEVMVSDALLRRLRELGDLHKDGVLTEEKFTVAKQALLRRF
jgi:hypothetical protein